MMGSSPQRLGLIAVLVAVAAPAAAQEVARLEIEAEGTIYVTIEDGAVELEFLVANNGEEVTGGGELLVGDQSAALPALTLKGFDITKVAETVTLELDKSTDGLLTVTAPGIPPATAAISIRIPEDNPGLAAYLWMPIAIGAGFAALVLLAFALNLGFDDLELKKPVRAGWKLTESWAASLTQLSAILGTLLGGTLLGDSIKGFSKLGFVGLEIVFAGFVALSPIAYGALRKSQGTDAVPPGTLGGFAVAAFLTMWALGGQLTTLGIIAANGTDGAALIFVLVLIAVGALLALIYGVRTLLIAATALPKKTRKVAVGGTVLKVEVAADLMDESLRDLLKDNALTVEAPDAADAAVEVPFL